METREAEESTTAARDEQERRAMQLVADHGGATRDELLGALSVALRLKLVGVERFGRGQPLLRLEIDDKVVNLPQESLVRQASFRRKVFAATGQLPRRIGRGDDWDRCAEAIVAAALQCEEDDQTADPAAHEWP